MAINVVVGGVWMYRRIRENTKLSLLFGSAFVLVMSSIFLIAVPLSQAMSCVAESYCLQRRGEIMRERGKGGK